MNGGGSAGINGGATITNGTNSAPNTLNRYFFAFLKRISLFFLLLIFHIVVFPTLYLLRNRWQQLTLVMPLKEISFQLLRLFTKSNSNLSARSDRSFTRIYKGFTILLNWIAVYMKGSINLEIAGTVSLFEFVFSFLLANSFVFVFVFVSCFYLHLYLSRLYLYLYLSCIWKLLQPNFSAWSGNRWAHRTHQREIERFLMITFMMKLRTK